MAEMTYLQLCNQQCFLASIENPTKSDKLFDSYDKNSGGKQLLLVSNSSKTIRASVSPILLAPLFFWLADGCHVRYESISRVGRRGGA